MPMAPDFRQPVWDFFDLAHEHHGSQRGIADSLHRSEECILLDLNVHVLIQALIQVRLIMHGVTHLMSHTRWHPRQQ